MNHVHGLVRKTAAAARRGTLRWRIGLLALALGALILVWGAPAPAHAAGGGPIVPGSFFTCALSGGGVKCWGDNVYGELGDGTQINRSTPVDVCADSGCATLLSGVIALAGGGEHTCAVMSGGTVKCWGRNTFGQLGDGTQTDRHTPVDVCADSGCATPLSGVTALALGRFYSCALTTGGGVKCWGLNGNGQLGDGTGTLRKTPVDVCADSTCVTKLTGGVAALAIEWEHTCALTTGGGVKCWGRNNSGQLGDGTLSDRNTPVNVCADSGCATNLSGVAAVGVGIAQTCVLTTGGGVKCWGGNDNGQLGDGTTTPQRTPVDVPGLSSGVVAVAAGFDFVCALMTGGGVKCWGRNQFGTLGNNTFVESHTPVNVCADSACGAALSGATGVVANGNHACVMMSGGSVKCWGNNSNGELGDGTTINRPAPVTVSGITVPTAATLSAFHARSTVNGAVQVKWTTVNEVNVVGFNVWRQIAHKNGAGEWKRLNKEQIAAKQMGTLAGSKYSKSDKTAKSGKTYFYKLEIVFVDGHSEWSDAKRVAVKSQ